MMAFFLIWIIILLLISEKRKWKASLIILLLSGFFGFASLNSGAENVLLPMLTGLFGSSTIIASLASKTKIKKQREDSLPIIKKDFIKPFFSTIIVSPICSIFPGLGSSQAAVIGSKIVKRINSEQFMLLLGSINTLVMAVSFFTFFIIYKTRTGAVAALSTITKGETLGVGIIILPLAVVLIVMPLITLKISKFFSKRIHKINYAKISLAVLIFLVFIVILTGGFFGGFIFLIATLIGLTCINLEVRRSFLMGSLLLPTIIFYLPF